METMKEKLSFSKPRAKYVVPFWEPVIRQQNSETKHGYAARVFFYDKTQSKPLKMDGALEVYCFAEQGKIADNKPTKIVTFRPEDTDKFYSKSELGHSYTIWIPWDETDSAADKVSLIVKFRAKDGDTLMSRQATLDGPGYHLNASGKIKYQNADADTQVRQVTFMDGLAKDRKNDPDMGRDDWNSAMVERVISKETGPSQMQTTTLTLPNISRFARGPVDTVTTDSGPNFLELQRKNDPSVNPYTSPYIGPYTGTISPASYQNNYTIPPMNEISPLQDRNQSPLLWQYPNSQVPVPRDSQSVSQVSFLPQLSHYEPSTLPAPNVPVVPPVYGPFPMATSLGASPLAPQLR